MVLRLRKAVIRNVSNRTQGGVDSSKEIGWQRNATVDKLS